ncbi:MAG: anti-sigma factor [Ignavibacteriaceae bacterium]
MDKERFRELCNSYFLEDINSSELDELISALQNGDSELREIFYNTRNIFEHLPLTSELFEPSSVVKERIFNQIREGRSPKISNDTSLSVMDRFLSVFGFNNPKFAFTFSLILLAAILILGYYFNSLNNTVENQKTEIVQLKTELEKDKEILAVLQSKQIEIVTMNGLKINPAGYGKIIWDPVNKSAILQVSNLPVVPKEKDYQLWVIKDNKPISAGVFSFSDKKEETFFKISHLVETDKKNIGAFAITLEPKGGVPQPTGDMYLLGSPSS